MNSQTQLSQSMPISQPLKRACFTTKRKNATNKTQNGPDDSLFPSQPSANCDRVVNSMLEASTSGLQIRETSRNEFDESFDLFLPCGPARRNQKTRNRVSKTSDLDFEKELTFSCTKRSLIQCPLCTWSFGNISSHIKSCSSKRGLSDDQVADAWALQIKYLEERDLLGLPHVNHTSKGGIEIKEGDDKKKSATPQICPQEEGSKKTLTMWHGRWKSPKNRMPLLLRRTTKERDAIVTEKVAIVLMEENLNTSFGNTYWNFTSADLLTIYREEGHLWRLASHSPDNVNIKNYYVERLSNHIDQEVIASTRKVSLQQEVIGGMLKNLTDQTTACFIQEEDSSLLQVKVEGVTDNSREASSNKITWEPQPAEEQGDSLDTHKGPSDTPSIHKVHESGLHERVDSSSVLFWKGIIEDNDSTDSPLCHLHSLSLDWRDLWASKLLSDVTILLANGEEYRVHSLVIFARCPSLFKYITLEGDKMTIHWSEFNYTRNLCHAFFEYIYTGSTDLAKSLEKEEVSHLINLSDRHNLLGLVDVLKNFIKTEFIQKSLNKSSFSKGQQYDGVLPLTQNFVEEVHSESVKSCHADLNISNASTIGVIVDDAEPQVNKSLNQIDLTSVYAPSSDLFTSGGECEEEKKVNSLQPPMGDGLAPSHFIIQRSNEKTVDVLVTVSGTSNCISQNSCSYEDASVGISDLNEWSQSSRSSEKRKCVDTSPITSKRLCSMGSSVEILSCQSRKVEECIDLTSDLSDENKGLCNRIQNEKEVLEEEQPDHNWLHGQLDLGQFTYASQKRGPLFQSTPAGLGQQKTSFDKYLEDSLPSSISILLDAIESETDNRTPIRLTPIQKAKLTVTPSPNVIVKEDVTPLLDYSSMVSPDIMKELERFGLKKDMGRIQAKKLLRYIYEQIHPHLPSTSSGPSTSSTPLTSKKVLQRVNKGPLSSLTERNEDESLKDEDRFPGDSLDNSSQLVDDKQQDNLCNKLKAFIKSNKDLYSGIILYEPIWFNRFSAAIKEAGIKANKKALKATLDELGVFIRNGKSPSKKPPKKRTAKKQPMERNVDHLI